MDLGLRYLGSNGVRETRQEDGVIGNLASPGHREESASHHLGQRYHGSRGFPDSIVEDVVLGNLAPPGDLEESASHHSGNQFEPAYVDLRDFIRVASSFLVSDAEYLWPPAHRTVYQ